MLANMKVYLRALEPEDYKTSIAWRQDEEIWSMVIGRRYFVSEDYEKKWLEKSSSSLTSLKLAICVKESDLYIGNYNLDNIDFFNKSAITGLLIGNKDYWSGGFGTDASLLMLHHAFYDLGLERIESRVLLENKASIRVLEKCGYKTEGILRKAIFKNGKLQDLNLVSVLREDFDEVLRIRNTN